MGGKPPLPHLRTILIGAYRWVNSPLGSWLSADTIIPEWRWSYSPPTPGPASRTSPRANTSITIPQQQLQTPCTYSVSDPDSFLFNIQNFDLALTNVLGGYNRDGQSVTVGRMRNSILEWTAAADLLLPRYAHRSIAIGNNILHIGGNGDL